MMCINQKRLIAYARLMRLDKPIGILLLLWPTLWALWIASDGHPSSLNLMVFIAGTVLMRSAGCIMNDLADRNFDGHVTRTEKRPLVAGEVTVKQALMLAAMLSLTSFVLVLLLNGLTVLLSVPALLLAASYPYTKRFFALPQAYLGIAFGFGIPMAFAAVQNEVPLVAWLLLLANVAWSLAYDTEYAMVDRPDDLKIGIYSSAITFGRLDITAIMFFYGLMLALLAYAGSLISLGMFYYMGLIVALGIAIYHFSLIRNRHPASCFKAFLHNNWLGAAVFLGIVANYLMH
jgi:4-hydroxybenzoate polyprenyltransferase